MRITGTRALTEVEPVAAIGWLLLMVASVAVALGSALALALPRFAPAGGATMQGRNG